MADQWLEQSFSDPYSAPNPDVGSTSLGDYYKAPASSLQGILAGLGAQLRKAGENRENPDDHGEIAKEYFGRYIQDVFGQMKDQNLDTMSPAAKQNMNAGFSDPGFWTLSGMALKGLNMAPAVAAAVIPSTLFPGAAVAIGSAALTGGEISAASMTDALYEATDNMSDAELQKQVPMYRDLRASGQDEETARREFNKQFIGMKPAVAGVLGAIANSVGAPGILARGAGKAVTQDLQQGIIGRMLTGGSEAAIGGGGQGAGEDLLHQQARVEAGMQKDYDTGEALSAGATGAVIGGAMGAVASAAVGGHGPSKAVPDDISDVAPPTPLPDAQPGVEATPAAPPAPSISGATAGDAPADPAPVVTPKVKERQQR